MYVVTYCDKWVSGSGFETRNHILNAENVDCESICLDVSEGFPEDFAENEDYEIRVAAYESIEEYQNYEEPIETLSGWLSELKKEG